MSESGRSWLVLCVDDEPNILRALQRSFLDEPWEVLTAASGEEGVEVVTERQPDVILSDYRMPGMNGVEFLQQAKRIHPDCIRIVLSGYADLDVILAALNEGEVYRFLSKPWNDGELRDVVRKALAVKKLSDQNKSLHAELEQSLAERTEELHAKRRALVLTREVLELLPLPILVIDEQGLVTFANAESRTLLSKDGEEPVGLPAPPLVAGQRERFGHSSSVPGAVVRHMGPFLHKGEAVGAVIMTVDVEAFAKRRMEPRTAMSAQAPEADVAPQPDAPETASGESPPRPATGAPETTAPDADDCGGVEEADETESVLTDWEPSSEEAAAADPGPLPGLRRNDQYLAGTPRENGDWDE